MEKLMNSLPVVSHNLQPLPRIMTKISSASSPYSPLEIPPVKALRARFLKLFMKNSIYYSSIILKTNKKFLGKIVNHVAD